MKKLFQLISLCCLFFLGSQQLNGQNIISVSAYQTIGGIQLDWSVGGGIGVSDYFIIYRWEKGVNDTVYVTQVNSLGPNIESYSYLDTGPFVDNTNYEYDIQWFSNQMFVAESIASVWFFEDIHFVYGHIEYDLDGDCVAGPDLDSLPHRTIRASNATDTFYTTSNLNGYYQIGLPAGNDFEIEVSHPNPYYENCSAPVNVTAVPNGTEEVDFLSKAVNECPFLQVDIGSLPLVRCFDRTYYISYCNTGTAVAEDAYVVVTFDDFLIVNSTSMPWSTQNGQTYTFDLGNIGVNECGVILAELTVDCDADLGQTHCTEAHIYPDTLCLPTNPSWDGASIEVTSECVGTEVIFTIKNVGTGNMSQSLGYIVIEDNVMLMMGEFLLNAGEDSVKIYTPNGATYRMEAEQSPGHPGNSAPSTAVEGCGGPPTNFGFVVIYPEDDADPFISIDCRENVGSYDPNDKAGYPIGYGAEHFIERGQDIEYLIRFQNTGTAPAFTVRIEDVIDLSLDLLSLRPGVSSHPYAFSLANDGTAEFLFENINLPDSTSNESGSHGFVKFRISQTADLSLGTEIRNKAAIFFDFNDPIITNETLHTIGEEFVEVNSVHTFIQNVSLKVFPNPFTESAQFELEGLEGNESFTFNLFDVGGKLVRKETFQNNVFQFNRNGLISGLYFFEINNAQGLVGTGKVMVK